MILPPQLLPSGRTPRHQRGITLVVALIFLVVLTLIAVTAAQNSGQEERMAGNTRNRDLAFQAADATLSYVEKNLTTISPSPPAPLLQSFNGPTRVTLRGPRHGTMMSRTGVATTGQLKAFPQPPWVFNPVVRKWPNYVVEQMPNSVCRRSSSGNFMFLSCDGAQPGVDPTRWSSCKRFTNTLLICPGLTPRSTS